MTETRFTLRLTRHRMDPDAGFVMSFVRVEHEGDSTFAAAGRTCQISLSPHGSGQECDCADDRFPAGARRARRPRSGSTCGR